MNASILTPSGASAGVGFAIPVDTIKRQAAAIIKDGSVKRPGLGISILPSQQAIRLGIQKGVAVFRVSPGSAAAKAGMIGCSQENGDVIVGDVIVQVADKTINDENDLFNALDRYQPGETVTVTVGRLERTESETKEALVKLSVTLGSIQRT